MSKTVEILEILEDCIAKLGDDFQEYSDDCIWYENDLTCRLFKYLDDEPLMTHHFEHDFGNGQVPLVHTEHHKIDLNIYSPETAVEAIRDFANNGSWWMAKARMLAGVEIKYPEVGKSWHNVCDNQLQRLIGGEYSDNGYLLIFAVVRDMHNGKYKSHLHWYEQQLSSFYNKWNASLKHSNVKVYCVPGDKNKILKPEWFPKMAIGGKE